MLRGPLYQDGYRPQLSGHETFPLRYGWLKKAFDAVDAADPPDHAVFSGEDAIARFGVGKNMVASIRHWATAAGVIKEAAGRQLFATPLGRRVFDDDGLDPYMEHPATLWLIHWRLCSRPAKTTWFWAFNHCPVPFFDREMLVRAIEKLAGDCGWNQASSATVRRDVTCFVRMYAPQDRSGAPGGNVREDALESPFAELGLIRRTGRHDGFRFVRGRKRSLGAGVFAYAVTDFWKRFSDAQTLSFEALVHEPGSPGRIFLLDEDDVVERVAELEEVSGGVYHWSETAGLKQLIRSRALAPDDALDLMAVDYRAGARRDAA